MLQQLDRLVLLTHNAEETKDLGRTLAQLVQPGDVIPLWGGFGVGKTTFTQGLAEGLGVREAVVSPSFGLVNIYHGTKRPEITLYHLDLYRISSRQEAEGFGADEFIMDEGVALVEWPEVIKDLLPPERLDVNFEWIDENNRRITLAASGKRFLTLLTDLEDKLRQDKVAFDKES